jgi:hypothetical protein
MVMRYLGGVNSPSYNPLAANVTTGTTVVQDGGVYTVASAAQANGNTQWINDPFFSSNTILLQADNFANASQNNTFLDSSQNNFTVTRNGNATQGSFNPVATPSGYWANNFNGTSDSLTVPAGTDFAYGTGDFTVEGWLYATSTMPAFGAALWSQVTSGNSYFLVAAGEDANPVVNNFIRFQSSSGNINSSIGFSLNSWNHFAVVRISGSIRVYLNGVGGTATSNTLNFNNTTFVPNIARYTGGTSWFPGYISNLRVVKGVGVYTGNFTPPTAPLTATQNAGVNIAAITAGQTVFLGLQSNRLVDNSSTPKTISTTGSPVIPSSPFRTSGPGQYPAIQWGASMSFNGTTQYLGLNGVTLSNSTFTAEAFIYPTATITATKMIVGSWDGSTLLSWTLAVGNTNTLIFEATSPGTYTTVVSIISANNVIAANAWNHIAVVRNGNVFTIYANGTSVGTATNSLTIFNGAAQTKIGGNTNSQYFPGLISNARVVVGTALYTANFTPPTQPLTAVTNTQLLTCQGSAVDSSTNNFTITNNNAVTASTLGPFTIPGSTGSMYFDGTGDYLDVSGSANLAFGTGDWTIELWVNSSTAAIGDSIIYDSRPAGTNGLYPTIYRSTNTFKYFTNSGDRITSAAVLVANAWQHVVVSRVSGTTRMFINGVTQTTTYTDANNYLNGASRPRIGDSGSAGGAGFSGYVSNLRVLKGTGVTSVTVPTAPLTAIANTQLLLNGTNAGIYDASARAVGETVGNAQVSTAIKKYGSGSMAFDGTGDWLLVPNSSDLNLGTGDFTIECWLNMANTTAARSLIGKGASTTGWGIYFNATPTLFIFEAASALIYSNNYNLIQGQWYHLAVVRSGLGNNNLRMYINGFLVHEATVTTDLTTTSNMYVGASRTGTQPMFGYVDDLRISKFARYTGQFVPPAVAMQDQG